MTLLTWEPQSSPFRGRGGGRLCPACYFGSPEGRVVKNGSSFEFQYAIGDHQGNTRAIFTSATQTPTAITATFEGDGGDQAGQFSNVNGKYVVTFTAANYTPREEVNGADEPELQG